MKERIEKKITEEFFARKTLRPKLPPKLAVTVFLYTQMRSLDLKARVKPLTENRGYASGYKERRLR